MQSGSTAPAARTTSSASEEEDAEYVDDVDVDVDVELATPLIASFTPDKARLSLSPRSYHRMLPSSVQRAVSQSLLLVSLLVLCYWSIRLLFPSASPLPAREPSTALSALSHDAATGCVSNELLVTAAPSFPTAGLYLPAGWSPSAVSPSNASSPALPSVRIAFRAYGWWFRGILEWAGRSLFHNFSVVDWDPTLENVWVVQSYQAGDKPGPDTIDRSKGQRRLFVSGEPLDFYYLNDFDAIIDTKRVPFTRPARIHAVYLPYYAAALYELTSAVQLLKPATGYSGEMAHNLTHRHFAAYMQGHCVSYRDYFFDRLERYKHIDGLGKCKHNVAGDEEAAAAGGWQTAVQVYSRYKFVLCMENSMQQGYITEKILTVMLARAIPVYIGAPDVALHFDEHSFIHLLSFASVDEAVERIAYLDSNHTAYLEVLSRPWMSNNRLNAWLTNDTQRNLFYQQMQHLRDVLTAPGYQYTGVNTDVFHVRSSSSSSGGGTGGELVSGDSGQSSTPPNDRPPTSTGEQKSGTDSSVSR